MLHSAASDLGLHCLPVTCLGVSTLQWVKLSALSKSIAMGCFVVPFTICTVDTDQTVASFLTNTSVYGYIKFCLLVCAICMSIAKLHIIILYIPLL